MKLRNVFILAAVTLLIVIGFVGYETWREQKRNQVPIDTTRAPSCDLCSTVKRDLAEQVRERKQQSEQKVGKSTRSAVRSYAPKLDYHQFSFVYLL